jgi:type II secretory pathway pseudopilin PulG
MAALLVGMSVMAVMLGAALPVWQTVQRRERETELVFRGEQYVQAIALFQRRHAGTFPPSIDVLVEQRFLRRRYRDPITGSDFRVLYAAEDGPSTPRPDAAGDAAEGVVPTSGQTAETLPSATPAGRGGIVGVVSTSPQVSLRLYNGRGRYNQWVFVATRAATRAGAPPGAAAIRLPPPPPDHVPPLRPR